MYMLGIFFKAVFRNSRPQHVLSRKRNWRRLAACAIPLTPHEYFWHPVVFCHPFTISLSETANLVITLESISGRTGRF